MTEEERLAAIEAGIAYEGSGTPTDYTSVTRPRTRPAPTSILEQAMVKPEGSTTDNRGITVPTVPQVPVVTPAEPIAAAEIFRSMLRTGQEVGGSAQQFRGATGVAKRSSMADALRIGGDKAATRTATPRTIGRKKKQNILGLNISPGIGLQI